SPRYSTAILLPSCTLKKDSPRPVACTVIAGLELIAVFEPLESTRTYSATGTAAVTKQSTASLSVARAAEVKVRGRVSRAGFLTGYIEGFSLGQRWLL